MKNKKKTFQRINSLEKRITDLSVVAGGVSIEEFEKALSLLNECLEDVNAIKNTVRHLYKIKEQA